MAKALRVGSRVRVVAHFSQYQYYKHGGVIVAVNVPGQTSKSGTARFKYVKFDDGVVLGFFTHEIERVNK